MNSSECPEYKCVGELKIFLLECREKLKKKRHELVGSRTDKKIIYCAVRTESFSIIEVNVDL